MRPASLWSFSMASSGGPSTDLCWSPGRPELPSCGNSRNVASLTLRPARSTAEVIPVRHHLKELRARREAARGTDLRQHEPDARRRPCPARQKTKVQLEIAGLTIVALNLTVQGHAVFTHMSAYPSPGHSLVPRESAPEPEPITINGQINVEGLG
jgi:hypothetical protein